ncbi:hypothetical protein MMC22_001272 [Lobaria immixta]|nr:hypothetical protein [Lobaria immixta]
MESAEPPEQGLTLWCAHIATLHDETHSGPNPLSRWRDAFEMDNMDVVSSTVPGKQSCDSPETHILAYCMVVNSTGAAGNEYRRVGIAGVKYYE